MERAQSMLYLNKRLVKLIETFKSLKRSLNGRLSVIVNNTMNAGDATLVKSYAFAQAAQRSMNEAGMDVVSTYYAAQKLIRYV